MGTGRGLGGPNAAHLAQVPVVRRIQALQVLLGSAGPVQQVGKGNREKESMGGEQWVVPPAIIKYEMDRGVALGSTATGRLRLTWFTPPQQGEIERPS